MTHPLHRRSARRWAPLAALVLLAATTGCSENSNAITSPITQDLSVEEAERLAQRAQVVDALQQLVDAYNTRDAHALKKLYHGRYHFVPSPSDEGLDELNRRDVLTSVSTMFEREDVLDVSLSITHGEPVELSDEPRLLAVEATVHLEVTMPDVFGPPIVYVVNDHPAEFHLVSRGQGFALYRQFDRYEPDEGQRVEVPRTWGQVLEEFMP